MNKESKKFGILYRLLGGIGLVLIIATFIAPIWWVALQSIQYPKAMYPKGIRIEFKFDGVYNGCEGVREREELAVDAGADCLIEMNKINHFIGMYPVVQGVNDLDETGEHVAYPIYAAESLTQEEIPGFLKFLDFVLRNSKYFFVLFVVAALIFILISKKVLGWLAILAGAVPFYFLGLYMYSLYWYGHHMGLHGGGAFAGIKPFMPTVFGEGKVAQFTTMSYPYYGFFIGLLAFVVMLLAVLVKRKYVKSL
jgi:hypothetical protein